MADREALARLTQLLCHGPRHLGMFAFSWRTDKQSHRVVHAVTATCLQCKFLLELQRGQVEEPRVVHVTRTTRIHCSWGGVCRADKPAAGRTFCDSDLQAVMHVSLAFCDVHRWIDHHNYMQHIRSIWQRSAMGQLVNINTNKTTSNIGILFPTGSSLATGIGVKDQTSIRVSHPPPILLLSQQFN